MTTETTPVERAAETLPGIDPGDRHLRVATARAALTAALDRDEIARAMWDRVYAEEPQAMPDVWRLYLADADAVIAHLTGGAR